MIKPQLKLKTLALMAVMITFSSIMRAQTCSNTATSSSGQSTLEIKKCHYLTGPIQTGQQFYYDITFSASGNPSNIIIEDLLPQSLEYLSTGPLPPGMSQSISMVGVSQKLSWVLTSAGSGGQQFTFRVYVRFKPGVTCDGTIANNNVSIEADGLSKVTTDLNSIPVEAEAIDSWVVLKQARSNVILPGGTVYYDIIIYNPNGSIGTHNLLSPSITDLLPTGAILVSSNCSSLPGTLSVSQSGINNANISPYRCLIEVTYPISDFPVGSCPVNSVSLSGTNPCGNNVSESSDDEICVVQSIPPVPGAILTKSVVISNPVPGCSGKYQIEFRNTGNVPITDFILTDIIPVWAEVQSLSISNSAPIVFDFDIGGATSPSTGTENRTSPGTWSKSKDPSAARISDVEIKPQNLNPGDRITVNLTFIVSTSAISGTAVTNTANLISTSHGISLSDDAIFTVEDYAPKLALKKQLCPGDQNTKNPGDVFTYRLLIQNKGSQDLANGMIEDILDPKLEFLGNSTVRFYKENSGGASINSIPCAGNSPSPPGTTDLIGGRNISFDMLSNTFTMDLPTIPFDCSIITGSGIDPRLDVYVLEFNVKVKIGTRDGIIPNTFKVSNGQGSWDSNTYLLTVPPINRVSIKKFASVDNGVGYSENNGLSALAGNEIWYKIELKNIGSVDVNNILIIDALPNIGDQNLQSCTARGSTVNTVLTGSVSTSPNFSTQYSTELIPNTSAEFGSTCGTNPAGWSSSFTGARSIKMISTSGFMLIPGATEFFYFRVRSPHNASSTDLVCNNATTISNGVNTSQSTKSTSNSICVNLLETDHFDCCEVELLKFETNSIDPAVLYTSPNGQELSSQTVTFGIELAPVIPIQELRIKITDLDFETNYSDCEECQNNPALWGSIMSTTGTMGTLNGGLQQKFESYNKGTTLDAALDLGENRREIIWSNQNGTFLGSGTYFDLRYIGPAISNNECCVTKVQICIELSYKDAMCNLCTIPMGCHTMELSLNGE